MSYEHGQMWPEERQFLYRAVYEAAPAVALEVGTWRGRGSTLQIAQALADRGRGHLHTCEVDEAAFAHATAWWAQSPLRERVSLHLRPSTELIRDLLASGQAPDLILFDGPEDPLVAMDDMLQLLPALSPGCTFMMHDWDLGVRPDGLRSVKAATLRPWLEASPRWQLRAALTAPASVGLCRYELRA